MNWNEADDGMVLMQGELWKPEVVQKAAAKKFIRNDGKMSVSVIKRYHANYPENDLTTPSFREFKSLGGGNKRK